MQKKRRTKVQIKSGLTKKTKKKKNRRSNKSPKTKETLKKTLEMSFISSHLQIGRKKSNK